MPIWKYLLLAAIVDAVLAIAAFVHLDRASDQDRFHRALLFMGLIGAGVAFLAGSWLSAVVAYMERVK